ncbi:hypothetical protein D043_4402A, partial [Vibrio parahaemolyticus EKP-021]
MSSAPMMAGKVFDALINGLN